MFWFAARQRGGLELKRALIIGITGQDGSYLAEHLLHAGYEVWGTMRGQDIPNRPWVKPLLVDVRLVEGDLLDQKSLINAVDTVSPDEVYNLGAVSYVPMSWTQPEVTTQVTALGVLRVLEAIRTVSGLSGSRSGASGIRFYQASSSEMYGWAAETPQNESTRFHPRSPYAVAKAYGHHLTVNYRESYGVFGVSGILFNHESPRRGVNFVTRKITLAAAKISQGVDKCLRLGNLDAQRDWGFAGDYVRAMHMMLQQPTARDYVIGSGRTHSVRDVVRLAFDRVGLTWQDYVVVDHDLIRPAEVDALRADTTRARNELSWRPEVGFEELIGMMVESDLQLVADGLASGVGVPGGRAGTTSTGSALPGT